MNHELSVGRVDRLADLDQKFQPVVDPELEAVAVVRDGLPANKLHRQVGRPVVGDAAVEQSCHVGVLEAGQDLSLGEKPRSSLWIVEGGSDELERDPLLEETVGSFREEDLAHSATSEYLHHAIGADLTSEILSRFHRVVGAEQALDFEGPIRVVLLEQLPEFVGEGSIHPGDLFQP